MKKLKILVIIFLVISMFLLVNFLTRKKYTLNVPTIKDVVSINLNQKEKSIFLSNDNDIKDIFNMINEIDQTTIIKSDGTNLKESNDKIKISFNYEDKIAVIYYVYNKKNKYYLEEYTNGIYKINKEDYEKIKSYLG